ncbi:MAG: hypothetical protein N3D82_04355 [Ignisphaera sp.]|nr:hypothetical protein [Ignisphaera sp.]MCX8168240.1 hypothetical protein [Ignisphaera sp.]MDW8084892.1 hypothetical protein [Ignisphaera sp.]
MVEQIQSLKYEYELSFKKLIYIDDDREDVCNSLTSKYSDVKFVCTSGSYVEGSVVFGNNDAGVVFLYKFYLRCLSRYRICIAITRNERVLELAKNAIDNDSLRPLLKKFRTSGTGVIMIVKTLGELIEIVEEAVKIARGIEEIFVRLSSTQ